MSTPIKIVDITQDFCTRTYGTSPCVAALGTTGAAKCFNTFATCQDTDNYLAGDLVLSFTDNASSVSGDAGYIASLNTLSITAPELASISDGKSAPLGKRGKISCTFIDHQWDDNRVDKYAEQRATGAAGTVYTPLDSGTFWGKWRARVPYYSGRSIVARTGLDESDLTERAFVIESMAGIGSKTVTLVGKDPLMFATAEKAQAPLASRVLLNEDLSNGETAIDVVVPAGVLINDQLPTSGTATISDELITFTRTAGSLTLTATRSSNSVVATHATGDTLQRALVYSGARVDVIGDEIIDDRLMVAATDH